MKKTQPGEAQKFLSTLTPKQFTWVGRTAMFRVEGRGTFQLSIWSGGTHGQVAGLDGVFTSDAGTQEHITFRFADHLVSSNPTNHPNYKGHEQLVVIEHCGWEWYIARPASLEPLHGAIRLWVELHAPSKHFSKAKGQTPRRHLVNYKTGERIRLATVAEFKASVAAAKRDNGRGVISVDGVNCYVDGGAS